VIRGEARPLGGTALKRSRQASPTLPASYRWLMLRVFSFSSRWYGPGVASEAVPLRRCAYVSRDRVPKRLFGRQRRRRDGEAIAERTRFSREARSAPRRGRPRRSRPRLTVVSEVEALQAVVRWRLLSERLRLERETAELRKRISKIQVRLVRDSGCDDRVESSALCPGRGPRCGAVVRPDPLASSAQPRSPLLLADRGLATIPS
jgi:hypothetical protein